MYAANLSYFAVRSLCWRVTSKTFRSMCNRLASVQNLLLHSPCFLPMLPTIGVLYSKTLITHKLQDSLTTPEHLFWFGWCKKAVFITIFCNLLTFTYYFLYNRKRYRVDS